MRRAFHLPVESSRRPSRVASGGSVVRSTGCGSSWVGFAIWIPRGRLCRGVFASRGRARLPRFPLWNPIAWGSGFAPGFGSSRRARSRIQAAATGPDPSPGGGSGRPDTWSIPPCMSRSKPRTARRLWGFLERLRAEGSQRLRAAGPGGGLLAALSLGDRSGLSLEARDTLARLGLSHLIAVSGLHLTLIAALAYAVGRLVFTRLGSIAERNDPRRHVDPGRGRLRCCLRTAERVGSSGSPRSGVPDRGRNRVRSASPGEAGTATRTGRDHRARLRARCALRGGCADVLRGQCRDPGGAGRKHAGRRRAGDRSPHPSRRRCAASDLGHRDCRHRAPGSRPLRPGGAGRRARQSDRGSAHRGCCCFPRLFSRRSRRWSDPTLGSPSGRCREARRRPVPRCAEPSNSPRGSPSSRRFPHPRSPHSCSHCCSPCW